MNMMANVMTDDKITKCMQGLLKASDIARILAVNPKTILNWSEAGKIPVALRAGRTVRFNICAVKQALDAATTAAQQRKLEQKQAAKSAVTAATANLNN